MYLCTLSHSQSEPTVMAAPSIGSMSRVMTIVAQLLISSNNHQVGNLFIYLIFWNHTSGQ
jgi:hypothetical protein